MKINVPETNLPRVVIVGGGFAGLELAKHISYKHFQVVLIDRNNYHTFQPLLYQVATAGIEADSIVFPLRKIFNRYKNFYFRMAKVERVLPEQNLLETSIGEMKYDHLVIATGSDTNFFGNEKIQRESMPMKSAVEALDLRHSILQNFERSLNTIDQQERESLMNFVIVGGGPTGVELAGALAELRKHVLPCDYPELDMTRMKIYLIEASPRVLNSFEQRSSEKAQKFLEQMGVQVMIDTAVSDYEANVVKTSKGQSIPSANLIWAAGVAGNPPAGLNEKAVNRGKRIEVDRFNQVIGYTNIYALGDVASMTSEEFPKGHPMVAQVAIQQGRLLAKNFNNMVQGKPLEPFKYKDKGSMATVGRNRAVVEIGKYKTQGVFAWFMWMFVHLATLIGFRNKLVVFINWVISYMNYDRGMRLIMRPFRKPEMAPVASPALTRTQPGGQSNGAGGVKPSGG